MLSIPSWLAAYWPALLTFGLSAAAGLAGRAKGRAAWLPAGAAGACLAGWAASAPAGRLREAALAPGAGPGLLVMPACAAAVGAAVLAWRGGRNRRLIALVATGLAGWWLARVAVPGEFWRVWILVCLLAWGLSKLLAQQAMRGAALALALWGGLVVLGAPAGWLLAASVLAAGWAGLLAAGASGALPVAVTAVALGWVALTRGRAFRFQLAAADWACLSAMLAPLLAAWLERRWGRRLGAAGPAVAAALGAAGAVGGLWLLRRTGFA